MAEHTPARKNATAPRSDVNNWMKQRNAQVRAGRETEAAGRKVWAHSTRTGGHLEAHRPADVHDLGRQALRSAGPDHGAHHSALEGAQHALETFQSGPPIPRPSLLESAIPVVGPAWEFAADVQQKHYGHAALDAAVGLLDVPVAKAIVKGGVKVLAGKAFYVPKKERTLEASYNWKEKVRPWMAEANYLKPGQHGHHGLIPQNGWGKAVSNKIKNQPWNIKPMPDSVTHMKIHGLFGHAKFNPLQRYWHGTPSWWKAANASAAGHGVGATISYESQRK